MAASLCSISFAERLTGLGMPVVESCARASHLCAAVNWAARALPMPSKKACSHGKGPEQLPQVQSTFCTVLCTFWAMEEGE